MLPTRLITPIVVAAALTAVTACGQGFTRDDAVGSFAAANPDASNDQSVCVIDRLLERYGLDELEAELVADPRNPAFEEAQFRDMFACGLEGDVEAEIAEQLRANGVEPDDAPCVAGELVDGLDDGDIDVLLSGEITETFMGKFVDAMSACDAIDT